MRIQSRPSIFPDGPTQPNPTQQHWWKMMKKNLAHIFSVSFFFASLSSCAFCHGPWWQRWQTTTTTITTITTITILTKGEDKGQNQAQWKYDTQNTQNTQCGRFYIVVLVVKHSKDTTAPWPLWSLLSVSSYQNENKNEYESSNRDSAAWGHIIQQHK